MKTTLTIEGQPKARFVFKHIPSWNEAIAWANQRPSRVRSHKQARFIYNNHTQVWRSKGEAMALRLKDRLRAAGSPSLWAWDGGYFIRGRALVIVKSVRGTEHKYDIHNPWVKPILDGFSDAGLWRDDEWAYVPVVIFRWAYDVEGKGKRFEIEVYELDDFIMNGVAQVLPEGRAK